MIPVAAALAGALQASPLPPLAHPAPGPDGFQKAGLAPIRGITIGPIENALHPGVGYGTPACGRALDLAKDLGATWVAFTPFGRMWSTRTVGIDLSFEAPFAENLAAVGRAIDQAHARGLRVMLVPHLWLEAGGWRGELEPLAPPDVKKPDGSDYLFRGRATEAAMKRLAASYRTFVLAWTDLAEAHHVDMLSVGVELRSWATSARATEELRGVIKDVRARYHGILTYSANWDDVDDTVVLREIDAIGINAFYPLADQPGASTATLLEGGLRVGSKVRALADAWQKPVLFTEVGYTTRPDPAVRPWEWPDDMKNVVVDEVAQHDAYRAILSGVVGEPWFAGFFVWRLFSDPDDSSQEAPWGFPFHGKLAEHTVREAFASRWAGDGFRPAWVSLGLSSKGWPGLTWSYPRLSWPAPVAGSKVATYPAGP